MRKLMLALLVMMGCGTPLLAAEPLAQLEARVQAAEAVRAVKRLQHAYGHYLDAGRWRELSGLFTADARAELPGATVDGALAIGRHFMQQAGRGAEGLGAGQLNTHLQLQPIVTVSADGRTVRGTWHELAMLGTHGKSARWAGGVYENEYVATPEGWKMSRLRYFPQYAGDYDAFGHQAPARWNIPYHYEAKQVGVVVPAGLVVPGCSAAGCGGSAVQAQRQRAQLAGRITRLQDETDVQNLQHAFGYYLDRKSWDDVADLFADGGELQFGDALKRRGAQAIRAALSKQFGAGPLHRGELFDHVLLGTVVSVDRDGRHARAYSTQLAMLGRMGEFAAWELGAFDNRYVKEGDTWKLLSLHYQPTLVTDYDLGWARDWRPRAGQKPLTFQLAALTRPAVVQARASIVSVAAPHVETLDLALRRVIAVDATENLMSHYGYTIDESAWDAMADSYSVTAGAKEITGIGTYVGRERIREILNRRGPKGGRTADFFTIHQLTQPVIHVSADAASAKARLRLFQDGGSADGSSGSWIGGIYENTAVLEDGEWKFGIQDLHHIFNASYRNGWARVGGAMQLTSQKGKPDARGRDVAGGGIRQGLGGMASGRSYADGFPPDRPIRAKQYAFPQIIEPGFHYRNPVSGRAPVELVNAGPDSTGR